MKICIVTPDFSETGQIASQILSEELSLRGISAVSGTDIPDGAYIAAADARSALSLGIVSEQMLSDSEEPGAEGFRLFILDASLPQIAIIGADRRGCIYGAAYFLRKAVCGGSIRTDRLHNLSFTPRYPLRGHQLGYQDMQNSCPAWTAGEFDRYIRDLLLFGANAIELMSPYTDDVPFSPLFVCSPHEMLQKVSETVHHYSMDVWLRYPYTDTGFRSSDRVFSEIPYLDALFVPAGDSGQLSPEKFLEKAGMLAENALKYHPEVKIFISLQNRLPSPDWLDRFFGELSREPDWLYGICYAPRTPCTLEEFCRRLPEKYRRRVRLCPDITHTLSSQFEIPGWDTPFALLHGRESCCPRPQAVTQLHRLFSPCTIGSIPCSAGVHDDINQFLWAGLDEDPSRSTDEILGDYVRCFMDPVPENELTGLIFGLERNWSVPACGNAEIERVFRDFEALAARMPEAVTGNYRFKMLYLRAALDLYAQKRAARDEALEKEALEELSSAPACGADIAVRRAWEILNLTFDEPESEDLVFKIQRLADELARTPCCRIRLSTARHRAQKWTCGAWLDTLNAPLNDMQYLTVHFRRILRMTDEAEKQSAVQSLLHRKDAGKGGQYICPGIAEDFRKHVEQKPEKTWQDDPQFLSTPHRTHDLFFLLYQLRENRGWAGEYPIALNWIRSVQVLYGAPLHMNFSGLDPAADYELRVTYPDMLLQSADMPFRLTAGTQLIHRSIRPVSGEPVYRFLLPKQAYSGGTLRLTWKCTPEKQQPLCPLSVSEIWIIRKDRED